MPRYTFNGTTAGPDNENLSPIGLTLVPQRHENRKRVAWVRDANNPTCRAIAAVFGATWQEAEARAERICRLLEADDGGAAR